MIIILLSDILLYDNKTISWTSPILSPRKDMERETPLAIHLREKTHNTKAYDLIVSANLQGFFSPEMLMMKTKLSTCHWTH